MENSETLLPTQQNFIDRFTMLLNNNHPGWIQKNMDLDFTIIDIGFGAGDEFRPLKQLFPKASFLAIDKDDFAVETAEFLKKIHNLKLRTIRGDAGDSKSYLDLENQPVRAKLIIIRNPSIFSSEKGSNWYNALEQAKNHLGPDGLIYITTEKLHELHDLHTTLKSLGLKIEVAEDRTQFSQKEMSSVFPEDFIMIATKKQK
ncbi:hypothetical protein A2630_02735 [Candidatus Woesebacteria bacterium RIFCSPHIGHO2_01_FULL_44_10]|uniref:Methyltransferase small domain-containing protein n=1 Tax=Candidatus Woesebacteria bacterium RIFCSPLOWO2_01_FULL_44_14 TaxID=1802525 RepID=A0A1F8C5D9_9BACT|nr:MAG: hypothetical protein A2630_02735 [Candidatus Woesebacteria bacterium RIFCSPHIGHO2_01_FULL_44_10]OGM56155.1 MAG: hypothetical protein A3F62_00805 [Candidatus Woesebacteria bacterium RIFCSPHIGHO2_12_FULL_44_11]OGM70958.1 MAG: hypothetical protein A2975_01650 [Candidatus Woesebacteria bacterium RIFCSPLOWO2_01_FULL_44_14]